MFITTEKRKLCLKNTIKCSYTWYKTWELTTIDWLLGLLQHKLRRIRVIFVDIDKTELETGTSTGVLSNSGDWIAMLYYWNRNILSEIWEK